MKKLNRMWFELQMDREIDPTKHYISPGGYSCNGKNFDFNNYEGNIDKSHPDRIFCNLSHFDDSLGDDEDEKIVITEKDLKAGFDEFYIYTGENGEPEIYPEKLIGLEFEFYDDKKDEYTTQRASDEILDGINQYFEKEFGKGEER